MATYAIGDIQGCFDEFLELLDVIDFDKRKDQLWLTGDLVNRGPKSLSVLRKIRELGDSVVSVLGNHDLYLIALARVPKMFSGYQHTLEEILMAPDKHDLIDWLSSLPFIHYDKDLNFVMVHAGLYPSWDLNEAKVYAGEIESQLRDNDLIDYFLANVYGDDPRRWRTSLLGIERMRFITNSFTRMRYCTKKGTLDLKEKKTPKLVSPKLMPWFAVPSRTNINCSIVFGHWSTLILSPEEKKNYKVYPVDTGAVWKGTLTAIRIDDLKHFTTVPKTTGR